jgi:hypothetical protein
MKNDIMKNASGYWDPTAGKALLKVYKTNTDESVRFNKLLNTLFYIIDLAGFEVEGRIILKDKKTGKVWR